MNDFAVVDPIARAEALRPLVREAGSEAEAERALPASLVRAISEAGLFRLLVPKRRGGLEAPPPVQIRVMETLAREDASTAWCVNQAAVFATSAAFMSDAAADAIFADPHASIANGPSPTAIAERVDGGYRVSGDWNFSSGIGHATWLAGLCAVTENGERVRRDNGAPLVRHMLFPRSTAAVRVDDVWQVHGLRATGSQAFAVEDLFVADAFSVFTYGDPVREPDPLYQYPMILLFASGFSSVAIGVARGAIDEMIAFATEKTPRGATRTIRELNTVQLHIGQAEAMVRAARAYLRETVEAVWERVSARGAITIEDRTELRLATTHGIRTAADAVDLVYNACGAEAIYEGHPVQRRFQDIHVITQHVQGRLAHYESIGRHVLGLGPDMAWL